MSKLVEMVFEDGSKHLVDTETGEVKYDIFPVKWNGDVVYAKGIDEVDRRVPDDIARRSQEMGYKPCSDNIDMLVEDKGLSATELRILLWLGANIAGQNLSYTTIETIMNKFLINKSRVSQILSSLEDKKYITLEHKNTFGVGSRVLEVHPGYFWRGNYAIRDKYRVRWYRKSTLSRGEVLYSCPLVHGEVK